MSRYLDQLAAKRRRDEALIAALHGEAGRFDTGSVVPQVNTLSNPDPRPSPPPSGEPREVGWSEEVEVDASLFFPWVDE